jgi:dolichol-phosphate mannosyltransferase
MNNISKDINIWVVIPALNESQNLEILIPSVVEVLNALGFKHQVFVVDDGSTDNTKSALNRLSACYANVDFYSFTNNRGKAEALKVGFNHALKAQAHVIVMMDADGQDMPQELPKLILKLTQSEAVDLVTGARVQRNDRFVKRYTSTWYNRVTKFFTGVPGNDLNSGFKAFKPEVLLAITPMLYGELHRYITVLAHWQGFKVDEVAVVHQARLHGKTKYGISRFWRGMLDLLTVRFLFSYQNRPSHLFGGIGLVALLLGIGSLAYLTVLKVLGESIGGRPLLLAGVLFVVIGLLLILFGLLAELIVYSRHMKNNKGEN